MNYEQELNDREWSFSSLHTYEDCPYQLYLKYIERRDGESNFYAENGKSVHEVNEAVFTKKISIDDCTKLYAEKFELICDTTKESIMESTYEKCMDYFCEMKDIDEEKYEIIGVELKLNFKIGKYKFTGFADLVLRNKESGEVILVDHKQAGHFLKKDGTPLKNSAESFYAYKHQMYIYCKGLKEQFGINVDKIVWNHFKERQLTIIPFKQEEFDETMKWAVNTIEKIKKDTTFDCKRSYVMCSSLCDYRNDCEYKEDNEEE